MSKIKVLLKNSIYQSYQANKSLLLIGKKVEKSINIIHECLENNGKVFFCGNGGSAADAQHLTAELLIRLRPKVNRKSIPAVSLCMDTSTLTACGNDYSFNQIFSRPLESLSSENDVLVAISTSGNSKNVIEALKMAKKKGVISIGFLGSNGGKAKKYCDIPLIVKSKVVARIQEAHILLGHFILENVENLTLKKNIDKISE